MISSRKNILVTGANGQLGRSIRGAAVNTSDNYIFTDIAELDITDSEALESLIHDHKIDIIVNCAAYTNVELAEGDEVAAHKINAYACEVLASAARENGATLIHISTDYVFNGESSRPYRESDPTSPLGVYGRTKLLGERAIEASGCNYIIIRTSWLYSESCRNFMLSILERSRSGKEIRVVADQIGTPTYAGDLAEVIIKIISEREYLDQRDTYHYSGEGECSWYDFARAIVELDNRGAEREVTPCKSEEYPSLVTRPKYSVLDKTKIKERFNLAIPEWCEALARAHNNIKI